MPWPRFHPALHRILRISLAVAALVVAAARRAHAQLWTPMSPFNGGNWTACAAGPGGELFVISDAGTLHRSANQGASWANVTPGGAHTVVAVRPVSGATVVACASYVVGGDNPNESWLDRSDDDGNTWTQVQTSSSGADPFIALSTDGASTVFAITLFGSVWESISGGAWTHTGTVPLPIGMTAHDLLFDGTANPPVLYAATDAGLYTSPDGSSWSHYPTVFSGPLLHLALDPNHNDYLSTASATYQFSDGPILIAGVGGPLCTLSDGSLLIGGAYQYASGTLTPLPIPPIGVTNQVAVVSGSTLLAATSEGVLRSINSAQSWDDVAPVTTLTFKMIGALGSSGAVAVVGDAAYTAATPGSALQRTRLFGSEKPLAAVASPDGGYAASQNGGVFFSTDGGQTWSPTNHDFSSANVLALTRTAGGIIVVGASASSGAPIWWTSNDVDWFESGSNVNEALHNHQVTALAATGTTILAASSLDNIPYFSISTDGAQTWTILSSGQVPAPLSQLAAVSTTELYGISGGQLYSSTDGGHDWSSALPGSNVQSVVVDNVGQIWITKMDPPTVLVSRDHGATWAQGDGGTSGVNSLALSSLHELYAGGLGGWHSPTAPTCTVPGIVAWWPAEGNANDATGNGHFGALQNGATFGAGKVGMAFSLDGVNDNVSVPDSPAFHFTNAMSVQGWIKTTGGFDRYIATKHEDALYFAVGGGNVAPHKLSFWLNAVSSSWFAGSTSVDDGQWHHVAATYDGATMKVYVDGHLDGSVPHTGNGQTGTSAILIGARSDGTNASNFPGMIDELSVYNRALSSAEIQALAAQSEPCATLSVDDAPGTVRALGFAPPWPNPATRIMNFEFRTPGEAAARAEIVDVAGRRVSRPLKDQALSGGTHRFQWDGLDASGARVAAGVYLIRVTSGTASAVQRIVLVR